MSRQGEQHDLVAHGAITQGGMVEVGRPAYKIPARGRASSNPACSFPMGFRLRPSRRRFGGGVAGVVCGERDADEDYEAYLTQHNISPNDPGVAVGAQAAAGIAALRSNDGRFSSSQPPYLGSTGAGHWRPRFNRRHSFASCSAGFGFSASA